jgi:membrane fusion protein (multidrug efflux system)
MKVNYWLPSDNSEMFYFNVSEPEYLDYETDIKNRAQTK